MKIAQLSCSHIQTRPQRYVYKHRGLLKESEITGVKYMIKSQINPHLNINCAICFSNIETRWGALRTSLSPWKQQLGSVKISIHLTCEREKVSMSSFFLSLHRLPQHRVSAMKDASLSSFAAPNLINEILINTCQGFSIKAKMSF